MVLNGNCCRVVGDEFEEAGCRRDPNVVRQSRTLSFLVDAAQHLPDEGSRALRQSVIVWCGANQVPCILSSSLFSLLYASFTIPVTYIRL